MGTSTIQYLSMPRMQWFLHESKFKTPQIWYLLSLGVTQGWFIDPLWCFQTSWGVKYFLLIHGMCFLLVCYSRFLFVIPRCNYMVGQDGVQRHSVDLFYGVAPWCLHRNTSFAEKVLSTPQKSRVETTSYSVCSSDHTNTGGRWVEGKPLVFFCLLAPSSFLEFFRPNLSHRPPPAETVGKLEKKFRLNMEVVSIFLNCPIFVGPT